MYLTGSSYDRDEDGNFWFAIGSENVFTSCNYGDLGSWADWYDEEWIEEVDA